MDYTSEFTGPQIDERLGLAGTAYQRPETGIPAEDLSEGVQEALDKADNAYIMPEGGIPAEDIADGVIPQDVAHKVSGATSGNFAALNAQGDLEDSGKNASDFGSAADVAAINEKIPTQASESNQLADKNFVNSSIQTETAHFRGNYDSVADLPLTGSEYGGTPTNNDYMVIRDTTGKLTHEPSPWYDETGAYVAGEIRIVDDGVGNAEFYLCLADNDYNDPQPPATSPAYWEWLEDWETVNPGGTWRFKYSGVWSVNGVRGWRPEYQVNEEPLTAAQIAALNSNITEALTNKLVALPAKPVDTAAQTLTDEQKAQARTNIGATAPEVFWAVYGSTTAAEIDAAVAAGKVVMCKDNNGFIYFLVSCSVNTNNIGFLSGYSSATRYVILKRDTGNWIGSSLNLQIVNNLVTSWQPTPDNTHYPAEKLVKDSLDAITPFVGIYNSTTFAEISAALTAGKEVWINRNGRLYQYSSGIAEEYSYYLSPDMGGTSWLRLKNATNEWVASSKNFQDSANKVTSLSPSSTDNQYPSAKAVYDFVKALADANNLTMP